MTYLNHWRIAFLVCFGLSLGMMPQFSFAQEDPDSKTEITLEPEVILGETDEEDETLSRLVDKSTIADLDFLNAGDAPTSIEQLKAMQAHVSSLYERVEPAVVNIRSGMGQGSGVVVTSDGYILTAAHVISVPNRAATITFPDGSKALAQTLGLFRTLDAGLLKIYKMVPPPKKDEDKDASDKGDVEDEDNDNDDEEESDEDNDDEEESDDDEDDDQEDEDDQEGDEDDQEEDEDEQEEDEDEQEEDEDESKSDEDKDADETAEDKKTEKKNPFEVQEDLPSFSYLDIGDSDGLNLGQWVIAVGHPGGLDEDRGIVLRVGRINEIDDENKAKYVRTDCTLVGGDSGGPLIGMDGSVIGIHSRIGQGLKMNFHVPSTDYLNNWSALLEPHVHDRDPQLNISFRGTSNVIQNLPKNSTAARSGLEKADRIIRVGEKDIYDKLQFDDAISSLKPFQRVEFEVQRKGKKQVITVTIGEKPGQLRRR